MRTRTRLALFACLAALVGCTTLVVQHRLDELYGRESPKEYIPVAANAVPAVEFERDIRPMMEKRCLVCHGCYDAPCQLKLDSYQGLLRGANATPVYHPERLTPAAPTRLFEDALTTREWRTRDFFPVLNERKDSPQANLEAGVTARLLDLKQKHPLPQDKTLGKPFDFSLDGPRQCPSAESIDQYEKATPLAGMPYGFPALNTDEHRQFKSWLAAGAPAVDEASLPPSLASEVLHWEIFLNGESAKQRLSARYIYEHLFLAHLYLEDAGQKSVYFKLVRSRTPPGQPIDAIASRRPFDDPRVERVYYRLSRDPASVIAKTHMPYRLSRERMARWQAWFIDADYEVDKLPGYDRATAANPFVAFKALPIDSRHGFLLDEAQFTVMNFIKGPVCRGSMALDVIRDRFWVFFTPPKSAVPKQLSVFLSEQDENLRLPAESGSRLLSFSQWNSYARSQSAYLKAKGDFLRANIETFERVSLESFWNGGPAHNPNAALTVFRHYDSATVVQGLVGEQPQTAWLIDYPVLERIHYLLVAGFDIYGTASHQVMTRMYMDFLRMESEMNFVAFLPPEQRRIEITDWYRGATDSVRDYVDSYFRHQVLPAPYDYRTAEPKRELFDALRTRMAPALNTSNELARSGLPAAALAELRKLNQLRGAPATLMPQSVIVEVPGHGLLTITSDSAHTNIASIFGEAARRVPAEDALTVASGVLTAYPDVFMRVVPADIPAFVSAVGAMRADADYVRLLDRFGVRRTQPDFWAVSDRVLASYRSAEPISAGVLDYNRYENR
jgi:hypothetical protein